MVDTKYENERSDQMNYKSKSVICPFFQNCDARTIRCEGIISDSISHKFTTAEEIDGHMEKFCNTFDYAECPYEQIVDSKYPKRKKEF